MPTVCIFDATNGPRIQNRTGMGMPALLEIDGTEYGRFELVREYEGTVERTPVYSTHLPTHAQVERIYFAVHGNRPGSRAVR